jgi:ribosomal protein L16/L10AE
VASVAPGRILLEVDGLSEDVAKDVLHNAAAKLCVNTKITTK